MTNPSPLEKQLLHLELSKGVNEKDRPETADSATTLTRVENLVQDQTGAYIKRQGTSVLTYVPNGGTEKLLRTREGLAAINTEAKVSVLRESDGTMEDLGHISDVNLTTEMVYGAPQDSTSGLSRSFSTAAYHIILTQEGSTPLGAGRKPCIKVYDRSAGVVIRTYDVYRLLNSNAASIWACEFTVVDNYLHIFIQSSSVGVIHMLMSLSALPASNTTNHAYTVVNGAMFGASFLACEPVPGAALLMYSSAGGTTYFARVDNASTVTLVTPVALTTNKMQYASYDGYVYTSDATHFYRYNPVTLALVSSFAHGLTITYDGDIWWTVGSNGTIYAALTDQATFQVVNNYIWQVHLKSRTVADGFFGGGATIQSWYPCSQPVEFNMPDGAKRMGIHLTKRGPSATYAENQVMPQALVSMEPGDTSYNTYVTSAGVGAGYTSARLMAILEPNLSIDTSYARIYSVGGLGNEVCFPVSIITTARGVGYSVVSAKTGELQKSATQVFGGTTYLTGGAHCMLSAGRPCEVGFVDIPQVIGAANAAAGSLTGAYRYIAVFRHVDAQGAVTWSRVSPAAALSLVLKKADISITCPTVTMRDVRRGPAVYYNECPVNITVELYRTLAGGTHYYLCASSSEDFSPSTNRLYLGVYGGANVWWTLLDNMSDAVLATQPSMFRQPGTPNSAVDRYPPPGGNILCQHKDRLFTTDPAGSRVYYSSFFVDGETAWYNPAFSFFVHGGAGPITGLASMDGRLFVFKRDAVFVVDGDGPGEGGVTGNEYSPPQRLATEHGCVDHRTLVITSEGLVYRSALGVEMLSRSLQVKHIGERVQKTVDAHTINNGACMDDKGRLHMLVSTTGGHKELVYDFPADCWTIQTYTTSNDFRDICMAPVGASGETICYGLLNGYIIKNDATIYHDLPGGGGYTQFCIETGWLKGGQQARARFSRLLALLKKNAGSNHALRLSVAFNYGDYSQFHTWEPLTINALEYEELEMQLKRQEVMAVRFKIEDQAPIDTGTYPIGDGRGPDILGITLEIATKTGAPKGPAGQKA